MSLNFNDADKQGNFDLIPANTVIPLITILRGIKETKAGDAKMLDLEFVVTAGEHTKRKIWQNMMITSNGSPGHDTAVNITRSTIRAMLESAHGIDPNDDGEDAIKARTINEYEDLNNLTFTALATIEKDKTGQYSDKQSFRVITPDSEQYRKPVNSGGNVAHVSTAANTAETTQKQTANW